MANILQLFVIATLSILTFCVRFNACIDCFKCISYDNDFPACDDPFHNNFTTDIFEAPCMGGRKGRDGLFPATSCVKITGKFENGTKLTLRGCALDSGTLTTDTELVRMSHCGGFFYGDGYLKGCVQSCSDADACNGASSFLSSQRSPIMAFLAVILFNYLIMMINNH